MEKSAFGELSSLVLVDTLAALPMECVVRIARLGHERLRQTCLLKWVTDRMTDVTTKGVVRAQQAGGDVADVFSTNAVLKKLHGKVLLSSSNFESPGQIEAFLETAGKVPGKIHICTEENDHHTFWQGLKFREFLAK